MEPFSKDKRTNRIVKRFQKGEITLEKANSLILQNDKVIDLALMYKIFQTIRQFCKVWYFIHNLINNTNKKEKTMTNKDKAIKHSFK